MDPLDGYFRTTPDPSEVTQLMQERWCNFAERYYATATEILVASDSPSQARDISTVWLALGASQIPVSNLEALEFANSDLPLPEQHLTSCHRLNFESSCLLMLDEALELLEGRDRASMLLEPDTSVCWNNLMAQLFIDIFANEAEIDPYLVRAHLVGYFESGRLPMSPERTAVLRPAQVRVLK
jgi:hypothetical protein